MQFPNEFIIFHLRFYLASNNLHGECHTYRGPVSMLHGRCKQLLDEAACVYNRP